MTLQAVDNRLNESQTGSYLRQFKQEKDKHSTTISQHIKQELRNKIQTMLDSAKDLSSIDCLKTIRKEFGEIQEYCESVGKTFIVIEEEITCSQFDLGGRPHDAAILFRGPNEEANVAVCVTTKGSLLHRNDSDWRIYRDAGDILCCLQVS